MNRFDFGWGEPFCVREALKHYYKRNYKYIDVDGLGYAEDEGRKKLIELTKEFLRETTGISYKHVLITNGTTGALNTVLRTLKKDVCYTHDYYFPYYDKILAKNGYKHRTGLYQTHEIDLKSDNVVGLVDSPSNPMGDLLLYSDHKNNIIWDSVYHNPVFINGVAVKPDHRVNCGSYSKVLGLTGARIGWIATNSDSDYESFVADNLYENCTISALGQELIVDILNNIDLNNFMRSAKYRINNNREMWDRAGALFDMQSVAKNGMFHTAWADPIAQRVLEEVGIKSVEIDQEGKDKFLRFNLAQTNPVTNKAIRQLLKK